MNGDRFSFWQKAYLVTLVLFLAVLGVCVFALADYSYGETVEGTEKSCITEAAYIRKALELELDKASDDAIPAICLQYADLCSESYGAEISVMIEGAYVAERFPRLVNLPAENAPKHLNISGKRHIVIVHSLQNGRITVVYGKDISSLDGNFFDMTVSFIAIYIGVSVFLAVMLYLMLKRISSPLEKLRLVTVDISEGNYYSRANEKGNDEFSELGKSFNSMLDTINSQMDELQEANEQKQMLIDNLAHELRTPLTSVRGYAEYMLMAPLSEEEQQESAEYIISQTERLLNISETFLDIAVIRNAGIRNERLSVGDVIMRVENTVKTDAKRKNVTFTAVSELDDADIEADEVLLDILLCNLCFNAIKACDNGGKVELSYKIKEGKQVFTVTDNGKGMTADQLSHVCEPFYRTDKSRNRKNGGTGLGLALCKQIADAHGATLVFESEPNNGTSVTVIL
jgi:signal transduction histidine kinase